jgi:hypothetical protein
MQGHCRPVNDNAFSRRCQYCYFMSLNIFAFSASRLVNFTSTRCLPAAFTRSLHGCPSIRFMSTPPFQLFVGTKNSRHTDMTRDIIKDAVDQQVQNRRTPDQRWQDRSKSALESVARTPPADTYSGRLCSPHVVPSYG